MQHLYCLMEKIQSASYRITTFFISASLVLVIFIAYAELSDIAATAATQKSNKIALEKTVNESGKKQGKPSPAMMQMPPVNVEAITAKKESLGEDIKTVGTLYSNESVEISSEVPGKIAKINFKNGDSVKEGQILFELENSVERAELNKAKANVNLVRNNVNRYSKLVKTGASSKLQVEDAVANLKLARASVEAAKARLEKTKIKAPFEGKIGIRNVSPGDFINVGDILVTLDQTAPLKVRFSAPGKFINQINKGDLISFSNSVSDITYSAKIDSIDSRVNETNRGVNIEAIAENKQGKLYPGQFVDINISLGDKRESVTIPAQAVVPFGNKNFVYKVADGFATKQEIEIGRRSVNMVEVKKGIKEGEQIVTAGHQKLQDGSKVQASDPIYVELNFMSEEKKLVK